MILLVGPRGGDLGRNSACGEPPPNSQELLTNIRPVRPLGDLGGDLGRNPACVDPRSPSCVEPRNLVVVLLVSSLVTWW